MEISGTKPAGSGDSSGDTPVEKPSSTTKKSPSTDDAFISMLSGSFFQQLQTNKALFDPVKDAIDEGKDE